MGKSEVMMFPQNQQTLRDDDDLDIDPDEL
jgi:hypothetical protein